MQDPITGLMINGLMQLANTLFAELSKPENVQSVFEYIKDNNCHSAADVAIDALDAYKNGKLSKASCLKVVQACLEDEQEELGKFMKRIEQINR